MLGHGRVGLSEVGVWWGVCPHYLGEVVLAVVAVAVACLHQAAGRHALRVICGHHADAAVALFHHDPEQDAGVDAVVRGDIGDGDMDAVHCDIVVSVNLGLLEIRISLEWVRG